jgi:cob(I)alamin adenosyltransferase
MAKSVIYTRTGDSGTTSLVGGKRVDKDDIRLNTYGTIDELNSWIGLIAASTALTPVQTQLLSDIQNRLFDIGSILATEPESTWQPAPFPAEAILRIENAIDQEDAHLPKHNQFILPGGHPDAARAHIARTVARRAERLIVTLSRTASVDPAVQRYINRLSDYLFILARAININTGKNEIFWQKP